MDKIVLKGNVFTGSGRGEQLIEKYKHNLKGILKFQPLLGTLNIKLEENVDIEYFYKEKVSFILLDGKEKINMYVAEVTLLKDSKKLQCWAIRDPNDIYPKNVIELIHEKSIRDEIGLKDDDEVVIEMEYKRGKKFKTPGADLFLKLFRIDN